MFDLYSLLVSTNVFAKLFDFFMLGDCEGEWTAKATIFSVLVTLCSENTKHKQLEQWKYTQSSRRGIKSRGGHEKSTCRFLVTWLGLSE